jgi:NADPH:quinone reductase-like Zn-dependent oxidoreductase
MKALIYRKFGSPDELEWTDNWPDPELSARSVLIKAIAGGVNPKDALLRKGKFSKTLARDPLPRASGLDIAGEIIATGSDVNDFSVGDLIFGMTNNFAGGVHTEIAKLNQTEFFYAPSNISIQEASCVPLAAQTALQALRDCCKVKTGHKVLINGSSGGVGHFAVQIAKIMGAEVHAVCGPKNVEFVESLGADSTYSYADRLATDIDLSFDSVFDVFGKFTRSAFVRQLGKSGIYVSTVPKRATILAETMARLGITKTSRFVFVSSQSEDLRQIKEWIESGLIIPHLEQKYPANQASDAHRHIETKRTVGKICLDFSL